MKKRTAILLLVLAAALAPIGALAGDVTTPEECAASEAPGYVFQPGETDSRGSFCLSDGDDSNGNELYVGGDASQPCGHIEIAGNVIFDESGAGDTLCH